MKIDSFEVSISPNKCFVHRFSITVKAWAPRPLKGIVEALAAKYPPSKAVYSRERRCVMLRVLNRMVGVYEHGLVAFCAGGLDAS